jgi:hypothetical protein
MKKILIALFAFIVGSTTAIPQYSHEIKYLYMRQDAKVRNKADGAWLTFAARDVSASELTMTLDYVGQVNFRNGGSFYLRLKPPAALDLSYTITLPDTTPPNASSIMVFDLSGNATFYPSATVGTAQLSSAWDTKDSVVTQDQVYGALLTERAIDIDSSAINMSHARKYIIMVCSKNYTVTSVKAVWESGSSPSATFQVHWGTNISAAGDTLFTSAQSVTSNTTVSTFTTFRASDPDANEILWFKFNTVPTEGRLFHLTVFLKPR